jgi:hypothetical protein
MSVRLLAVAGLTVLCTVLFGCKNSEDDPVNPYVTPGITENPNWKVTVDTTNLTASMTANVKVSFAQKEGVLAAFMGKDCCGVAEYKADYGLYWLFISPASEAGGNVQLKFYSPSLKRIFNATTTFAFSNDTQLGSIAEPYIPSWNAAN